MKEKLEQLKIEAKTKIASLKSETLNELNELKVNYLGKKGVFSQIMQEMKNLLPEERPQFGAIINTVKEEILELLNKKKIEIEKKQIEKRLKSEQIDITLPGTPFKTGSIHPLNGIIIEIEDWFSTLGYAVAEGPEVESDRFNFEMLNLPKGHPARDMQDTFYINEDTLLRTHTSPVQVRTLLEKGGKQPVQIICPGKVFRRDNDDATHSHQFMQIEGLVVDIGITMADLKGTLDLFVKQMFGKNREIRLRPSFFPFTEPSVEVDVSCNFCMQKGCGTCKHTGWIEILGAGMVHPNVLSMAGYDPKKYTGFAFGIGVERIAMLKYGVTDIRLFYTNDIRFLKQMG